MLRLPGELTDASFLGRYWQKRPLFMPKALHTVRPSMTRNELAWLATHDDVESRLVFANRPGRGISGPTTYRVESGPFDPDRLEALPKRDWTLLVHDVEKHLPTMRALINAVPFIPDWRVDDLMVSFAAPGGGVGPHKDNYDVFLCQGIGIRNWRFSEETVVDDTGASQDLALLCEFESGDTVDASTGDVLYLPPGVAHWGTARRACMTYSIGMRAPQRSDLLAEAGAGTPKRDSYYTDPDLEPDEAQPGYISTACIGRALQLLNWPTSRSAEVALALGRFSTRPKDWLRPEGLETDEQARDAVLAAGKGTLLVHGMARIAYDDRSFFINGHAKDIPEGALPQIRQLAENRCLRMRRREQATVISMLTFMMRHGAFEIPDDL